MKVVNADFGTAIQLVTKQSRRMARKGWKDSFIFLVPGSKFTVNRAPLLGIYPEGTEVQYHGHVDIKSVEGFVSPWQPSQADMLAEDWSTVD